MSRFHICLLFIILSFLTGCSTTHPAPAGYAASAARKGITVVVGSGLDPQFFSMGLTTFNNYLDPISDPGFSIGAHLVKELKSRGYHAKLGTTAAPGLQLKLYATYPYGSPSSTGVGVSQRRPIMMKWKVLTYCNIKADLIDRSANISASQPMSFGDKGYFSDLALDNTTAGRWAEFSPAEKARIKSSLAITMKNATNLVFKELGL